MEKREIPTVVIGPELKATILRQVELALELGGVEPPPGESLVTVLDAAETILHKGEEPFDRWPVRAPGVYAGPAQARFIGSLLTHAMRSLGVEQAEAPKEGPPPQDGKWEGELPHDPGAFPQLKGG